MRKFTNIFRIKRKNNISHSLRIVPADGSELPVGA